MSGGSEPVGTLAVALAHAAKLLAVDPAAAAEQAGEILKVVPDHPTAVLLMGIAQRSLGHSAQAVETLTPLARRQPDWAAVHFELGLALGAAGQGDAAVVALRHTLKLNPEMPDAWRALADHLTVMGDSAGADAAYAQQIRYSTQDPRLVQAAIALHDNDIPQAEALLRQHLKQYPTDIVAIRMFAEVAARLERYTDAQSLLERCLDLAPGFAAARRNYATVLHRQYKDAEALEEVDRLLAIDPVDPTYRNLKAAILGGLGRYEESIELYAGILARYPHQEKVWLNYGHALKTAGRQQDSIEAYRKCIALAPHSGAAYWSLANLKTFRFSSDEVEAMRTQLARTDLAEDDRVHFEFAAGCCLVHSARTKRRSASRPRTPCLRQTRSARDLPRQGRYARAACASLRLHRTKSGTS